MVLVFRGGVSAVEVFGSSTGMAPTAIKVEVVRTMVNSTSITSTRGMTFILLWAE